jgi:hypothetical protein
VRKPPQPPPPQAKLMETVAQSVFAPSPKPIVVAPPPIETPKPVEPKRKKPRLVAAVAVPSPMVAAPPPPEPEKPPPEPEKPGKLTVAITPWCDLTVDGEARGRAPLTLELPAGPHHVECSQPSGARVVRDVTLEAGATETLRERLFPPARVSTQLKNTQFAIDQDPPSAAARPASIGRHQITLYRDGKIAETGWVDVRPEGCRLVDTPKLACEKP